PDPHLAPHTFRAVDAFLIPASAPARLDDGVLHFDRRDMMRLRPPGAKAGGKHFKGAGLRHRHANGFADRRRRDHLVHFRSSSFSGFSASARKASSASSQNWSSQRRSEASPLGSMK